ncbi:DUF2515 domain-containing protein [Robertmurraya korlensis]|nr:DUF2515 domain-containing protein [Robertmurraya korlensis]
MVTEIMQKVESSNIDNISRTDAYFTYFLNHSDILWSFLASMVSRNAGWNMCDLEGKWFPQVLEAETRKQLYLTYERANWLIFQDAYPQLLLYEYSTKLNTPMFHLLRYFHVSSFMSNEWAYYWREKDKRRLMTALIINEQNIIQKPVIEHPIYYKKVFHSLLFAFQDYLHFSAVLFPTVHGELYGASVYGFQEVDNRIDLGKRLADILFDPEIFMKVFHFAKTTAHTGSRHDYEQFMKNKEETTPVLRETYPVIKHHIHLQNEWTNHPRVKNKWFNTAIAHRHPWEMTHWYLNKQKHIRFCIMCYKLLQMKKRI